MIELKEREIPTLNLVGSAVGLDAGLRGGDESLVGARALEVGERATSGLDVAGQAQDLRYEVSILNSKNPP